MAHTNFKSCQTWMQYRIKRHFILAGEAATDGPGIVKNCEKKKCGAGTHARACLSLLQIDAGKSASATRLYCIGTSLRGAT